MSLHDRYNRGGGRIQNLDRYLTNLGNRAGNAWHGRTGASRHTLTQGLYLFATWACLQDLMLTGDAYVLVFAGQALLGLLGVTQSRGGLVEEIQLEAARLPKSMFAMVRIFILFLGCFSLATAFGELGVALVEGAPIPFSAAESMIFGTALCALQAGEYIRRTNPPTISSNGHGMRI